MTFFMILPDADKELGTVQDHPLKGGAVLNCPKYTNLLFFTRNSRVPALLFHSFNPLRVIGVKSHNKCSYSSFWLVSLPPILVQINVWLHNADKLLFCVHCFG